MDFTAFLQALDSFVYIPANILAYARYAASRQDDDGRRSLLKKLQSFEKEVAPLEEDRHKAIQDALASLAVFESTHLPAIRQAAEEGAQKSTLEKIQNA